MANYPRSSIVYDGAIFHVTWKCHNEDWLLASEFAKQTYYNLLLKYKERYKIKIYSYCFMANHPHLTGTCESQELFSDFFRVVNSCFAKALNKQLKRKGQVVMDRFKSPVIQTQTYLRNVMIYNDLNPFRTKQMQDPRRYKWSSFHHYASGTKDPLITEPNWYVGLGADESARQKKYKELVYDIIDSDISKMRAPYREASKTTCFVGNPLWVKERAQALATITSEYRLNLKRRLNSFQATI